MDALESFTSVAAHDAISGLCSARQVAGRPKSGPVVATEGAEPTLHPIPTTMRSLSISIKIPQTFFWPITTSLGHFKRTGPPDNTRASMAGWIIVPILQ